MIMTIDAEAVSTGKALLTEDTIRSTLETGLAGRFAGAKVLALIPDHTRTIPIPMLFRQVVDILRDAKQLDFMVALGTHPPLSEDALNRRVGITAEARATTYPNIGLLNHAWNNPNALVTIGILTQEQIRQMAGDAWHPSLGGDVDIRINRLALEYDHIIILGPTFPHEIVGFSGGAKYLFPGISGPEIIHVSHWLGADHHPGYRGIKDTPVPSRFTRRRRACHSYRW
jgi:nickel-dependent lactate racemase